MAHESILYIEDEEDIRELVTYHLARQTTSCLAVGTAEEGLEAIKHRTYDLILLDLMLPGMDGLEFLRIVKATEAYKEIPVVILSARAEESDVITGLDLGAVDYVTKPFSPKILVARVRSVLRASAGRSPAPAIPLNALVVTPVFAARSFKRRANSCFVLMPFSTIWADRVWQHLQTIAAKEGFDCTRADSLLGHNILEDIWSSIFEASVIVADITDLNSNVMYEVGIAHTVGKSAILLTQDIAQLPFDFRGYRTLEYKDNVDGFQKLAKLLPNYLRERRVDAESSSAPTKRSTARRKTRRR